VDGKEHRMAINNFLRCRDQSQSDWKIACLESYVIMS